MNTSTPYFRLGWLVLAIACSVENNEPNDEKEGATSCDRACEQLDVCSPAYDCTLADGECTGPRLDVADCVNAADSCDEANDCLPSGGTGGTGSGRGGA